jgi:hypothetical protein
MASFFMTCVYAVIKVRPVEAVNNPFPAFLVQIS